jgi:calcium-dependent protein kinase
MLLSSDERAPLRAIDFGLATPFEPEDLPLTNLGLEGALTLIPRLRSSVSRLPTRCQLASWMLLHRGHSCVGAPLTRAAALRCATLCTAGTPWFQAPEVLSSQVTPACDVWAAGVMACQLLTGRLPFDDHRNPMNPSITAIWYVRACVCA